MELTAMNDIKQIEQIESKRIFDMAFENTKSYQTTPHHNTDLIKLFKLIDLNLINQKQGSKT
mgnify:CR=1 FL=1